MKGRYEQPKKKFGKSPKAANPTPRQPASDNRSDLGDYGSGYDYTSRQGGYSQQNSYYQNNQSGQNPYYGQQGYSNGGYSQQNHSQNSYSQQGYSQNGYSQQGYSQNSYGRQGFSQNGGYYPGGGYQPEDEDPQKHKGSIGAGILSFFLPIVGLILFFVWKKEKPGKAKSAGIGALVGFILTVILGIAAVVGVNAYINNMFDKVNQVEVTVNYTQATEAVEETEAVETTVETTEPPHVASRADYINILVAGQSSRGADDAEQARFADSMMLITINTYEKKMIMTSLLRDTLVKMPDYKGHSGGRIKLTTVYHLGYVFAGNQIAGSMECMDMALYNNFGIEVDYNFEIDFTMFETIINRLGGVTIVMDEPEAKYLTKELESMMPGVYSEAYGGDFKAGKPYDLDGFASLAFARMRHAEGDGDSDIKRTSRQQRFVKALLDKVKAMSISDLQSIANDVLPMVSTSMSSKQMADLMKQLLPMLPELKLESGGTCPANYKGEMLDIYKDGFMHSVLKFNEGETKEYMRELTLGEKPKSGKSRLTNQPTVPVVNLPTDPADAKKATEPTKPAETQATTEAPAEAPKSSQPEKPTEAPKPTEFVPPIQATSPTEAAKPKK